MKDLFKKNNYINNNIIYCCVHYRLNNSRSTWHLSADYWDYGRHLCDSSWYCVDSYVFCNTCSLCAILRCYFWAIVNSAWALSHYSTHLHHH